MYRYSIGRHKIAFYGVQFAIFYGGVQISEYPRDLSREHASEEIVMKDWTYFYD